MYSDQGSFDNSDADPAVGQPSDSVHELSREVKNETPDSLGRNTFYELLSSGSTSGSERTTCLGTPPPSSSSSISDQISLNSSRTPSVYTFDSSGNVVYYFSIRPQAKYADSHFAVTADGRLLRDLHGRSYNSTNQVYMLPADDAEQDRLDMQHRSLFHFVGGLFPWPERVEPHLVSSGAQRPAVLDIGTGSGTWALEMGRRYPHADVVGIDLAPPLVDVNWIPDNCRFEIDDANLSMMHYASTFDFVHMRAADMGVHDFEGFLYNVAQVLKPGAEMVLSGSSHLTPTNRISSLTLVKGCGDYRVYNERREVCPTTGEGRPGFSWFSRYFLAFIDSCRHKGVSVDAQFNWEQWLRANPNFEDIENWDMWMPVDMTPEHARAALLFRSSAINMIQSCKAALLDDGYPKEVVEHWQRESERELVEMKTKLYIKWHWTIFRRTRQPWIPQHQASPAATMRDD
ncbi:hypothetical protein FRB99_003139 [Tulasnella sp. 403]|nr:hypothetical protein FRB99_003139 [Tulasnella sp. 403]